MKYKLKIIIIILNQYNKTLYNCKMQDKIIILGALTYKNNNPKRSNNKYIISKKKTFNQ